MDNERQHHSSAPLTSYLLTEELPDLQTLNSGYSKRSSLSDAIHISPEKASVLEISVPQHSHSSTLMPKFISVMGLILHDLETHLTRLLSLNPSRREAIAQHLDRLAGQPMGPSSFKGNTDAAGGLRRWIEGPRTPSQNAALQAFFEEISLISLGQAILLKAWSDRGLRKWNISDLKQMNWALSTALKPHIPLDRDGWQITRPNLYSWYNPSQEIQEKIWEMLDSWRISDEAPELLISMLNPIRRTKTHYLEPKGYDQRFFKAIWDCLPHFGFSLQSNDQRIKRTKTVFSPTLRDGGMVRMGPVNINWVGLENSPFQLLIAELVQLWWGPSPPPFWAIGTGLEAHTRDQLSLSLGSPKPTLITRISEMEACDLAFTLEETCFRSQSKSIEAARLREQTETLTYFKKMRTGGTTLGDLQACVAISKLRPNGLLWWAREEALTSHDGIEVLNFLLDRAKLICEWDLSEIEHSLPSTVPLFPKYLYLLQREPQVESRFSHRPLRLSAQGSIRSHVELPIFLEDILQSTTQKHVPRGNWTLRCQKSPMAQKEWAEKWPDPVSHHVIRSLENLRENSLPLASVTTVRPTPTGDKKSQDQWSLSDSLKGIWISVDRNSDERKLSISALPLPGQTEKGSGFLVLVVDETWIAPLSHYLQSPIVQLWLDDKAERKGDRWVLDEQLVKWIPIPKSLLGRLGVPLSSENQDKPFALPLPGEWEKIASEVDQKPKLVKQTLSKLERDKSSNEIRAAIFIRAARALEHLKSKQSKLFSMVKKDGKICWGEVLNLLPKHECIPVSIHPKVKLTGHLTPHLPIDHMERVKAPQPGITFATETGFYLTLNSEQSKIIDMIWDQLQGLSHPTWSELLSYLKLPRRIDLAESTAADILRAHGENSQRLNELSDLLSDCKFF